MVAGEISTGSQSGAVSVLVTATERFGANQTLLILVKVSKCTNRSSRW